MRYARIFPRLPIGICDLTDDQINNPLQVLQDYFRHYPLDKGQELLWTMMRHATSPAANPDREKDADDMIMIYSELATLLQATSLLVQPIHSINQIKKDSPRPAIRYPCYRVVRTYEDITGKLVIVHYPKRRQITNP
jgi:hypothetical protein